MNIKIKYHLMPWEIDYALFSFTQLKKSSQHLNQEDKIYIDVALNLSNYIINWNESKLPKEFFINKFNTLLPLLDWAVVRPLIYDGDELWGHLDLERNQMESHIDYYIGICPDMWFHEYLLYYLIESAKQVKDKYFIITPETYKLWDWTWDELVNENYKDIPYENWNKSNIFEIQSQANLLNEPYLRKADKFKWAGWFDIYSKALLEELIPIPDEWKGYGPWDYFGMIISDLATKHKVEINEYILTNQIICEYHQDKNDKNNFDDYYKNLLELNKIKNQREVIESKFSYYIEQWIQYAKNKKII
jgi:hypothetical protein